MKIVKALAMPLICVVLLLIWQNLVQIHYKFFLSLIVFFIIGFIANHFLKKSVGYSFHIFFYLFLVLTSIVCFLITPSPVKTFIDLNKLNQSTETIRPSDLPRLINVDRVNLKDATHLKDAILIQTFSTKGEYNGSRGIVPIVGLDYKAGDSIYVYAVYTRYIGDEDVDGWFILDKDEEDYEEDWKKNVITARVIKDTVNQKVFEELMQKVNLRNGLVSASRVYFVQSNYPQSNLNYVAQKISILGYILLAFAALIHVKHAFKND